MSVNNIQQWIEDFSEFCAKVDVKAVVAGADAEGNSRGYDKELYAIAIVRAVHEGTLGADWCEAQAAVSRVWERGYRSGFNTDSFNIALQELANSSGSSMPQVISGRENYFTKSVLAN
jgi:hypothetical protein